MFRKYCRETRACCDVGNGEEVSAALQQLTAGLIDVETDAAGFPPSPVGVTCEYVGPAASILIQARRSIHKSYIVYLEKYALLLGHGNSFFGHG